MAWTVEKLRERDEERRARGLPPAPEPAAFDSPDLYVRADYRQAATGDALIWDGGKWAPGPAVSGAPSPSSANTQLSEMVDWAVNHGKNWLELDERTYDNSGAAALTLPTRMEIHGKGYGTMLILPNLHDTAVLDVGQKARITDCRLYVAGHTTSPALGSDPSGNIVRMEWHSHSTCERCTVEGFWTPFMLDEDHITFRDCETVACNWGMIRVGGGSNGNLHTERCYFTGCTAGSHFVATGVQEDSWWDDDSHLGFSPFGLYAQADPTHEFAYTNIDWNATSIEAWGNRAVGIGSRKISGVMTQPRTGMWDLGNGISGPAYFWADSGVMADHDYAFESGNVDALTSTDGQFKVLTAGGDQFNGSFVGGGAVGVFKVS